MKVLKHSWLSTKLLYCAIPKIAFLWVKNRTYKLVKLNFECIGKKGWLSPIVIMINTLYMHGKHVNRLFWRPVHERKASKYPFVFQVIMVHLYYNEKLIFNNVQVSFVWFYIVTYDYKTIFKNFLSNMVVSNTSSDAYCMHELSMAKPLL